MRIVGGQWLVHFDGASWRPTRRAEKDDVLTDVHRVSHSEVLVLVESALGGDEGAPSDHGDVLRFDGSDWAYLKVPDAPFRGFAPAEGGAYVYGNNGVIHRIRDGKVEAITPPTTTDVSKIDVAGDTIVGLGNAGQTIRGDGSTWEALPDAPISNPGGVAVDGRDAIWVGGTGGTYPDYKGVIAKYDGSSWSVVWETPITVGRSIQGLGGTKEARFAVGANGLVLRQEGEQWQPMKARTPADLRDVWVAGPNDVYAVGSTEDAHGVVIHYDGTRWSRVHGSAVPLKVVWGTGPDDVYAAGGGAPKEAPSPFDSSSLILHYNGNRWRRALFHPRTEGATFTAVWGNSPRDVFAIESAQYGDGGYDYSGWTLLHFDGSGWSKLAEGNGWIMTGTSTPHRTSLLGGSRPAVYRCDQTRP